MNSRTIIQHLVKEFYKSLINMTRLLGVYSHISLGIDGCLNSAKSDFEKNSSQKFK